MSGDGQVGSWAMPPHSGPSTVFNDAHGRSSHCGGVTPAGSNFPGRTPVEAPSGALCGEPRLPTASPAESWPPSGPAANEPSQGTSTGPLAELQALQVQLAQLEASVSATQEALRDGRMPSGSARDSLAQLEANVDRLQCEGIDSVSTSQLLGAELEAAKTLRRALTKRVEALHERMDTTFDRLREALAVPAA